MSGVLPSHEHDLVLAGVKAEPSGWPPASPDTGSGRGRMAPAASWPAVAIHKSQVSTLSGDCRTTMRYDRARNNLDRHPNYTLAAYMAAGT